MAFTLEDFDKIWASTSPLTPYEFSDSNYQQGWNFIGSTPPARQMWDFLQKKNDEKTQWLYNNKLSLSGGTLTGDVFGVTPPNGDNSKKLANTEFIQALADILVPIGCVQAFAGTTTPQGWLLCDGSAVSRTEYAALFTVIGTTYGRGNGTSTFNLPNLTNKFIEGSSIAGTTKAAGLPNITGYIGVRGCTNATIFGTANGALSSETTTNLGDINMGTTSASHPARLYFNASNSDSIYGNSTTVQPPALTMRYIIKY